MQTKGIFMEEKIKLLLEQIGRPYEMFNKDGTYQGCFYPLQFLYPDIKKYKLRSENNQKNYVYGMAKMKKYFTEIAPSELQAGDIITTKYKDALHIAVYLEFGKIIHVFKGHKLQIGRLKMFNEFQSYRVK